MTKISVLLPVYNTDRTHLRQAIDSVLMQTFSDFELLIYNDASTISEVDAVVESYHDERIRYTRGVENVGIARVRNLLVEMATGEYLAVMDHDDLCDRRRFASQVAYMDANPHVGVCGTAYKRFGMLRKSRVIRYPTEHSDIRAELFFKNVIHHPSAMMRRSVLIENGLRYDEKLISCNDRKLFMDIGSVSKLHNLPKVLCSYRMHASMTSRQKRQAIIEEQKKLRAEFLQRMRTTLDEQDAAVLNDYIMNGRCRIRDITILHRIENVLIKLSCANAGSRFLPVDAFDRLCAVYLIKRCRNAAFYGRINSGALLRRSILPVNDVPKPFWLKLFNLIGRHGD